MALAVSPAAPVTGHLPVLPSPAPGTSLGKKKGVCWRGAPGAEDKAPLLSVGGGRLSPGRGRPAAGSAPGANPTCPLSPSSRS